MKKLFYISTFLGVLILSLSSCSIKNVIPVIDGFKFKEIRLSDNKVIAYISIDVYNNSLLTYDIEVEALKISQAATRVAFLEEKQTFTILPKQKNTVILPLRFNPDALIVNIFQLLKNNSLNLVVEGNGVAVFKKRQQKYSFKEDIPLSLNLLKDSFIK